MYELTIKKVTVQGPRGIEQMYDVILNGQPIKGARHETKAGADAELKAFAKILQPMRGHYGYL